MSPFITKSAKSLVGVHDENKARAISTFNIDENESTVHWRNNKHVRLISKRYSALVQKSLADIMPY